jgi:hypothetical protein
VPRTLGQQLCLGLGNFLFQDRARSGVLFVEVVMIKKQYRRGQRGYFNNFIISHDGNEIIEEKLKAFNATLGKSKNKHAIMNVKWHDKNLYVMFVLRWT